MRSVYEYIQDIITPGLVFVEIGSNAGDTAQKINQMILEVTDDYRYITFEPDSRFTKANERQAIRYLNLTFHKVAVSNKNGEATLFVSDGDYYGPKGEHQRFDNSSSIKTPLPKIFKCWPDMKFDQTEIVETIRLDDCGIGPIDFIWCDIQGAELDFIEGAILTLRHTRFLYTEYNGNKIYEGCPDLEQILDALPDWKIIEDYKGDVLLKNMRCE